MTETIINLTPHPINLRVDGIETIFPKTDMIARVDSLSVETDLVIAGAKVSITQFGDVTGLPSQKEGTFLIVSGLVLSALKGTRSDCIAPKTDTTAIRNEAGHIIAVTGWVM